jgi:hypothetical protein
LKKFKVCEILDQSDNTEVTGPLDITMVEGFRASYRKHMKGDPHPDRDPIDEHWWIFGLRIQAGGSCYADLAIVTPYGKTVGKQFKFRTYIAVGDGRYETRELAGRPIITSGSITSGSNSRWRLGAEH